MMGRGVASVAVVALLGCQAEVKETPGPGESPAPARRVEIAKPDWSRRGPVEVTVRDQLSPAARRVIARAPVPTLAPREGALLQTAIATTDEHFVALSSSVGGVTVSVHSTRLSYHYPDIAPAEGTRALRAGRGFVTREEEIWTASFVEDGVAYSVDLECASATDARCADDRYLLRLVDGLAYVGGENAR